MRVSGVGFFIKNLNLTKARNKDWGNASDAGGCSVHVLDSLVDDQGRYIFEAVSERTVNDRPEQRPL